MAPDPYDLLRFGGAGIILVNAFHRIIYPEIGVIYTAGPILEGWLLTDPQWVLTIQLVAIALSYLLITDTRTFHAAGLLAFGIGLVIINLLIQHPLLGLGGAIETQMSFFDIALRNVGLVLIFTTIAIMAGQRQD